MSQSFLKLDGDAGGGQLLRNGFSMAALLGLPIEVVNIRGARNPPGLRPQHLSGIQMINQLSQGKLEGDKENSVEVRFTPKKFKGGNFNVDTKTAGSCTLLVQIALPCLLYVPEPSSLRAIGGTDVNWSPPIDEMLLVLVPLLRRFGAQFDLKLVRRGFFPRGGGEVLLTTNGSSAPLQAINLVDPGRVVAIKGRAFASGDRESQELQALINATTTNAQKLFPGATVDIEKVIENRNTASGFGSGITLFSESDTQCYLASTVFRDPKKRLNPQQVAEQVVKSLADEVATTACVDQHVQDQLLIFMALAQGISKVRVGPITEHTKLAIEMIHQMCPCRFEVEADGPGNIITCQGLGITTEGSTNISKREADDDRQLEREVKRKIQQ